MLLRSTLLALPSNRKVNPLSTLQVFFQIDFESLLQENGKSEHNCDTTPISTAVEIRKCGGGFVTPHTPSPESSWMFYARD